MLKQLDSHLSGQSRPRLVAYALVLIALLGAVDFLTGFELSFSIFYLIPVAIVAWYIRGQLFVGICILSAGTWLCMDLVSGHTYSHPLIPFWNAGVRFGFFIIIAALLSKFHDSLELQSRLAQVDGLTGLMNARTFKDRCRTHFDLSKRSGRPLSLGYIDLDGFKGINDRLGHSVGDEVLKAVAGVITQRVRSSDSGGRLGGDEFALLLPETDVAGATTFFSELHEHLLALAARYDWPVGFSMGVAVFHHFEGNVDAALQHADALMYQVKHSGKNRIRFEAYGEVKPGPGTQPRP